MYHIYIHVYIYLYTHRDKLGAVGEGALNLDLITKEVYTRHDL